MNQLLRAKSSHKVLAKLEFGLKGLRNKKQEVIWDHLSASRLPTTALDQSWWNGLQSHGAAS